MLRKNLALDSSRCGLEWCLCHSGSMVFSVTYSDPLLINEVVRIKFSKASAEHTQGSDD